MANPERSLLRPEPPPLDETLARQQIEEEVRDEYTVQANAEIDQERISVLAALAFWRWVGRIALVVVGVPLIGLVTGLAVFLFRWASGIW